MEWTKLTLVMLRVICHHHLGAQETFSGSALGCCELWPQLGVLLPLGLCTCTLLCTEHIALFSHASPYSVSCFLGLA